MEDNGFREVMLKKSTEELLEIVQSQREDYQQPAIIDAENILKERGTGIDTHVDHSEDEVSEQISHDTLVFPLIFGIIMVVLVFLKPMTSLSYETFFSINLFVNILIRLIVLVWVHLIAEKYFFRKTIWIILGLVFGGWALIAINIAVWIKQGNNLEK